MCVFIYLYIVLNIILYGHENNHRCRSNNNKHNNNNNHYHNNKKNRLILIEDSKIFSKKNFEKTTNEIDV